jgi:excisionase family DNA binding protein
MPQRQANPHPAAGRRLCSIDDAAAELACSPRTVRRMIASGQLTGYRVGARLLRVDLNEIETVLCVIPTAAVS